jgi:probable phosphoglycerate mutase
MSSFRSSPDLIAHIDGASRGNPGPAACAVIMETADGTALTSFSKILGRTTNNMAEYHALLAALDYALEHHYPRLKVMSDSELLTLQIKGIYKIRSADLKPLHERARRMIAQLQAFTIVHVPRERNRKADQLANKALDIAEAGTDFAKFPQPLPRPSVRASATYHRGILRLHRELPLAEGEEVELDIRRKK